MSQLPTCPHSPEQQQKAFTQIYLLMGKQVQSYHRHHHMGNNTSIPAELAQELMRSVSYTISLAGGPNPGRDIEEEFLLGQRLLENRLSSARSLLELVCGTAPQWQTECRWEALRCLRHYLDRYDHLHLAHKWPEDFFYPSPLPIPDGIQGIDKCLYFLDLLWVEDQIMASFREDALNELWDRLPSDTMNQCEHLVINALGKTMLDPRPESLVFTQSERMKIISVLQDPGSDPLAHAVQKLSRSIGPSGSNIGIYINAVASGLSCWIGNHDHIDSSLFFL